MEKMDGMTPLLRTTAPMDIDFKDIFYSVKQGRKGIKSIIKGVSGTFKSGELTAIMGPSGAGKTSLLNILTGFRKSGTSGTISCTGKNDSSGAKQYKKESCYILQDDNLDPLFTVYETMKMAAELKLGKSISSKSKQFLIDDILDTLSLKSCCKTRCQRLSGGQKKRLSVALELIDNPPIMFLDEPTSGLDSSSSFQCISMLKNLAKQGRNIVCTIHQPSASLYELFDFVYVMAEGKCIYQGASTNTVPYLAFNGFNCPHYHNPADYLLEVANGEYGNFTDALSRSSEPLKWRKPTAPYPQLQLEVQEKGGMIVHTEMTHKHNHSDIKFVPSELHRFRILVKRVLVRTIRDWTTSLLRIVLHLAVGAFIGFSYLNSGDDGSRMIQNVGLLIINAVYLCYTSLMPAVLKFPSEMAVLRKEHFNNWYQLRTYYMAFLIADIPLQIIFSTAYISINYYITAQPMVLTRFSMVLFIYCLVSLVASSMGLFYGALVNPVNGTFLAAITTALMLSVGGFLIFFTHMSAVMYLLSYISYLSYALEAIVQSLYGYGRKPVPCPEDVEYCHYKVPEMLLKEIGMNKPNYWNDVIFLFGNIVFLRVITFCTLKFKLAPK